MKNESLVERGITPGEITRLTTKIEKRLAAIRTGIGRPSKYSRWKLAKKIQAADEAHTALLAVKRVLVQLKIKHFPEMDE